MSSTIEGPADHLDTIFYVDGIKTAGFTLPIELIIKPLAREKENTMLYKFVLRTFYFIIQKDYRFMSSYFYLLLLYHVNF